MRPTPRVRRYEAYWEKEPSLAENVDIAWALHKPPMNLGDVALNLAGVMCSLQDWSKKTVGSVNGKIERLRKDLRQVSKKNDLRSQKRKKEIEKELDGLLEKEEIYWKQRSRIEWLKESDRNTKFFHRKSTWRKKKNNIQRLKKEDGSVTDDIEEMSHMATNFFKNLYTADLNVEPNIIINLLEPQISEQMNESLCGEF